MRKGIVRCPLIVLALAFAACSDSSGPEGLRVFNCNSGVAYVIGQTKTGALTTRDCRDPGGQVFADYYQFTVSTAGPVSITVTTNPPVTDLEVILYKTGLPFAFEGEVMSTKGTALVGGMLEAGTYILVVQAIEPGTIGSGEELQYTVTSSATEPPPFDCLSIAAYTPGTTVQGTLVAADCRDENGYAPADYYRFTVAEERNIGVTLTSVSGVGPVRAALYALDELVINGTIAPPGAVVSFNERVDPGTYILIVSSDSPPPGATYRISATLTAP